VRVMKSNVRVWQFVCLVLMMTVIALHSRSPAKQEEGMTVEQLLALVRSASEEDHDRATERFWEERRRLLRELCDIVDPKNADKHSNDSRLAACLLLGETRAPEATRTLALALENPPRIPASRHDLSWRDWGLLDALIRIGRPAVPEMIKNIRTSDNENVVETSVDVLWYVLGGKRHTLELIDKLIARETDEQVKKRLANARKIAEARQEKKEPLY